MKKSMNTGWLPVRAKKRRTKAECAARTELASGALFPNPTLFPNTTADRSDPRIRGTFQTEEKEKCPCYQDLRFDPRG